MTFLRNAPALSMLLALSLGAQAVSAAVTADPANGEAPPRLQDTTVRFAWDAVPSATWSNSEKVFLARTATLREKRKEERIDRFAEVRESEKGLFTVYGLTQDNVHDEKLTLRSELSLKIPVDRL